MIFYPRFYPWHLFSYLFSWERASIFPFQCSVLDKGTTGNIFITSLVWSGPWLGIETGTYRNRSQHSITRLSRRRYLGVKNQGILSYEYYNRSANFYVPETGASKNPCADTYCGPKAFSEVEVKGVADFLSNITGLKGFIDFHSYSQLWMSPWGYTKRLPKDFRDEVLILNCWHIPSPAPPPTPTLNLCTLFMVVAKIMAQLMYYDTRVNNGLL